MIMHSLQCISFYLVIEKVKNIQNHHKFEPRLVLDL
jgi:hypothetical protein